MASIKEMKTWLAQVEAELAAFKADKKLMARIKTGERAVRAALMARVAAHHACARVRCAVSRRFHLRTRRGDPHPDVVAAFERAVGWSWEDRDELKFASSRYDGSFFHVLNGWINQRVTEDPLMEKAERALDSARDAHRAATVEQCVIAQQYAQCAQRVQRLKAQIDAQELAASNRRAVQEGKIDSLGKGDPEAGALKAAAWREARRRLAQIAAGELKIPWPPRKE